MVRKDPTNQRGPAPPGGRQPQKEIAHFPGTLFELIPMEEYIRIWDSVLIRLESEIKLVEQYANLGLPVVPVADLEELRDHLNRIIKKEVKRYE